MGSENWRSRGLEGYNIVFPIDSLWQRDLKTKIYSTQIDHLSRVRISRKSCDVLVGAGTGDSRLKPQNLNLLQHTSVSPLNAHFLHSNLPPCNMPSPAHLISKVGDPIFAAVIGLSAAATRINREEKELGRSTQQTIDAGLRYDK